MEAHFIYTTWLVGYESYTRTSGVLIPKQYICRGIKKVKVQFHVLEVSVIDQPHSTNQNGLPLF